MSNFALPLALFLAGAAIASADTAVFTQNFDASTTISDYVSTSPNAGQVNAITSAGANLVWSINASNQLQGDRTGTNAAAISRTFDLSIVPNAFYFQVDFNLLSTAASETSAITFQFGTGFGTANSAETNSAVHSRFTINLVDGATDGWQVRDFATSTNSATFTGAHKITFVVNNTDSLLTYGIGGGISGTVATDTFDLWIDSTSVFDDRAATTASIANITDFKIAWSGVVASQATFDNLSLTSVPEPQSILLIGGGLATCSCLRRRVRIARPGR